MDDKRAVKEVPLSKVWIRYFWTLSSGEQLQQWRFSHYAATPPYFESVIRKQRNYRASIVLR